MNTYRKIIGVFFMLIAIALAASAVAWAAFDFSWWAPFDEKDFLRGPALAFLHVFGFFGCTLLGAEALHEARKTKKGPLR